MVQTSHQTQYSRNDDIMEESSRIREKHSEHSPFGGINSSFSYFLENILVNIWTKTRNRIFNRNYSALNLRSFVKKSEWPLQKVVLFIWKRFLKQKIIISFTWLWEVKVGWINEAIRCAHNFAVRSKTSE